MGGDNVDKVPADVLGGAAITAERYPNARFLAFGDAASVKKSIDGNRILEGRVDIRPTKTVISNDAKPSSALRNGRSSSTWAAVEAVRDGEAAGVVSASNTGALMLISKSLLKTLPRIDRPAICSVFPTLRAEIVMLDLGATIKYNENNLFQFAVMGAAFATAVLGRKRPTVGLLNVGTEELKGNDAVREAAARLRQAADLPFEFRGFIEGNGIPAGAVDVVVTDGFTGNVAVKTAEGAARLYSAAIREGFRSSITGMAGYFLARRALAKVHKRLDPRLYNGAVLVGLNGIVVKSHGNSDALAFANAIEVAVDMVQHGFTDDIRAAFEGLSPPVTAVS